MSAHAIRLVLGLAAALPGPGDDPATGPKLSRFEFVETHMGSPFKIVLYSADEATARRASRASYERIAALDAALSDYNPESELMRLCDKAGGPPVRVGDDLFEVLSRSLAMSEKTGGAFDVTIGPVVRLWRRARRDRKMPAPDLLAEARARVGYRMVRLDRDARTVQLLKPGMKLDLGAIAKGYASDEAIKVLKHHGIDRALVAGAGDIVASGPPPGASGWTVGIAPAESPDRAPGRFVALRDAAISTSGDAERFVEIDGKRYSHIVDPRTGLGMIQRASVTVVAPDGATADALDTSIYLLGPERGFELVDSVPGASALFVRSTPEGEHAFESRRFKDVPTALPSSNHAPVISPCSESAFDPLESPESLNALH